MHLQLISKKHKTCFLLFLNSDQFAVCYSTSSSQNSVGLHFVFIFPSIINQKVIKMVVPYTITLEKIAIWCVKRMQRPHNGKL